MSKLLTAPDPTLAAWPTTGELVIIDLEWTAWEGSLARGWSEPWEYREVIAVGAVRVGGERFDVRAETEVFVKPVKNPELSPYIVVLTGITDALLEERGASFATALSALFEFAAGTTVVANGSDGTVLRENCLIHETSYPFASGSVCTIRPLLAAATGKPAVELVSAELPALLGFGEKPAQHGALADARAIASTLAWLRERGRI